MVRVNIQRPIMPSGYDLRLGNGIWKKLTIRSVPSVDMVRNRIMIELL